jgi:hypothetical protein
MSFFDILFFAKLNWGYTFQSMPVALTNNRMQFTYCVSKLVAS